LREELLCNTVV